MVRRAASYGYSGATISDEVHLLDYWRAVRKRLWLVIGVAFLCTTLAMIYMARKPDIYQASARVQVNQENDPAYSSGKNTPLFYANDPGYFNTQLQILSSTNLLGRVVKTLDLANMTSDFLNPQSAQERSDLE